MKTYVKSNGSLHSGNTATIKVYSSLPSDLSDINESEVIILENVGFYQKENNSLTPLFSSSALPVSNGAVGDIIAYYGSTNPDPANYVVCNGSTFSSTDFPALYTLLGNNTTPDLTGYHLKGIGETSTWNSHDAILLNTKVASNYPNHSHTTVDPKHTHSVAASPHYHTGVKVNDWEVANVCSNSPGPLCYKGSTFDTCDEACVPKKNIATDSSSILWNTFCSANLGAITVSCPNTASGYNVVRYGNETKCKDKTVLFLMRAKI